MTNSGKFLAGIGATALVGALLAIAVAAPASAQSLAVPGFVSVDAVAGGSPLGWGVLIGGGIVLVVIQVWLSRSTRRIRRKSSE